MFQVRYLLAGATVAGVLLCGGCGQEMEGTYADGSGFLSIEFVAGKAYVTTVAGTSETTYRINGDKIILQGESGNLVLTVEPDGTLSGAPLGSTLARADS